MYTNATTPLSPPFGAVWFAYRSLFRFVVSGKPSWFYAHPDPTQEWRARAPGSRTWHRHPGTPTQAALDSASKTLALRLAAFGLKNASVVELTSGNQPSLQVEVPHFGSDEHAILGALLEVGQLAFWNTGQQPVTEGSTFDPTQFTQYNPAGKPHFTGTDLDSAQIRVGNDQTGRATILFAMKGPAIARFGAFTQQNIGTYLTLTLDLQVIQSAIIQSAINGPAQMTGNFTRQQATALVSVLKYPPLPVVLHISSETSF